MAENRDSLVLRKRDEMDAAVDAFTRLRRFASRMLPRLINQLVEKWKEPHDPTYVYLSISVGYPIYMKGEHAYLDKPYSHPNEVEVAEELSTEALTPGSALDILRML